MENQLFPIEMKVHMIFAIVSFLVFGMQFIRYHKKYHLLLAVAVPCSLLPYVIEGTGFFYAVGIAEMILLVIAFILAKTVDRDKKPQTDSDAAETNNAAEEPAVQSEESVQEEEV